MTDRDQRYPKSSRLTTRAQFLAMNRDSLRQGQAHFIFLARPNGLASSRLGITASRRVGGAVLRNRVKRLLREAWRLADPPCPPGWDLVAIARASSTGLSLDQVAHSLQKALRRLGPPPA